MTPEQLTELISGDDDLGARAAADGFTEITVDRSRLIDVLRTLRDHPQLDCNLLLDICGVDYPDRERASRPSTTSRASSKAHRLRVKVPVSEDDPICPRPTGSGRRPTGSSARPGT
jgi:NADH-quinone oxidoreductase subunit C